MEEHAVLSCDCNFAGLKPIMVDLPYPPICVEGKNLAGADLVGLRRRRGNVKKNGGAES